MQAQLKNPSLQPLDRPSVTLFVTRDGTDRQAVSMPADPNQTGLDRKGRFMVELPVLRPGEYRLELIVPESADERVYQTFRGVVPKLEEENPQRDEGLLQKIAQKTQGAYYADLSAALSNTAPGSLVDRLQDVHRTDVIPLAPKPEDEEKWLRWMLIALCCVLALEWLVRRLVKLA